MGSAKPQTDARTTLFRPKRRTSKPVICETPKKPTALIEKAKL